MPNLTIFTAFFLFFAIPQAFAQNSFSGGQTGASEDMLKAVCPAFAHGKYQLVITNANQSNVATTDVFEHETGARCACSRNKTDKSFRSGPAAPKRF